MAASTSVSNRRERQAWFIFWASFVILCLVLVAVPLGARAYVLHAEERRPAVVESLVGTVVVEPPIGSGSVPLGKGHSLAIAEGSIIRVDETSEAYLTFFDHSVMHLFSGTTVRLERTRSRRYEWGVLPNAIRVHLVGGRINVGTALSLEAPLEFVVEGMHGETLLNADGTYTLLTSNERSDVEVFRGGATVIAQGEAVDLSPRQRTQIALGQPPDEPTDVARNLIANGEFRDSLSNGWRVFNDQGSDGGDVDGRVEIVVDEGRRAVRLVRVGGDGNHCETVLEQVIDRELTDPITSLVLRATVRVRYQSLSGGGYLSSEYPLMVRLTYRDAYDSETEWVQGFYYQNVAGNPTTYGLEIAQDRWYTFESENLLETLAIRPSRIMRIRLYASGWDYDSLISDVSLIAE